MIHFQENEKWMLQAIRQANEALNSKEVPIGAIIVKDGNIVGRGYNQVEGLNDATAHAEILAITSASSSLGDWRLNGSYLYVTKQPCLMCWGAINNARIEKVFYGLHSQEFGLDFIRDNLKSKMPHLKIIEGGILEFDCKKIIQDFFLKKR